MISCIAFSIKTSYASCEMTPLSKSKGLPVYSHLYPWVEHNCLIGFLIDITHRYNLLEHWEQGAL